MNFPGFEFEFSADHDNYCFHDFVRLDELKNPASEFIVNDTCMIEVGFFVPKYVDENEDYQPLCKLDDKPDKDKTYPLFRQHIWKNRAKFCSTIRRSVFRTSLTCCKSRE